RSAVEWLVRHLKRRDALVIPATCLVFALGGVLDNMKAEIIALVPVMLLLVRRLGFDPVTAVAASLGSAAVGAAFSPINPFQVGIAQQLAQLALLSGGRFRVGFLLLALGIWIWGTLRYAVRTRAVQEAGARPETDPPPESSARRGAVLVVVLATFVGLVVGVLRHGWGFDQMAALFFAMGIVAGVVYQYGGGLCELLTPTNGALMAILAAAGVRYEHWLRFVLPLYGLLLGLGAIAITIGIGVGLR